MQTFISADAPIRSYGEGIGQPPVLRAGDLFTVRGRPYQTFEAGNNDDADMRSGYCRWPRTFEDVNVPVWAFPHAAVIASTPQERPQHKYQLEQGSVVLVPGYGWYRLALAPNDNVRFEAVA